jgi:hypothetical protein
MHLVWSITFAHDAGALGARPAGGPTPMVRAMTGSSDTTRNSDGRELIR